MVESGGEVVSAEVGVSVTVTSSLLSVVELPVPSFEQDLKPINATAVSKQARRTAMTYPARLFIGG